MPRQNDFPKSRCSGLPEFRCPKYILPEPYYCPGSSHGVKHDGTAFYSCREYPTFEILQASVEEDSSELRFVDRLRSVLGPQVRLLRGDHSQELAQVNEALSEAAKYCGANEAQRQMLQKLQDTFHAGDLKAYKEAQKIWVKDRCPEVEALFGFFHALGDPHGTRAEFEGVVCVTNQEGSKPLRTLVQRFQEFIAELPWVKDAVGGGRNGPFEKAHFEAPEYISVHGMSNSIRYLVYACC